jgi:hypothetical protein
MIRLSEELPNKIDQIADPSSSGARNPSRHGALLISSTPAIMGAVHYFSDLSRKTICLA